MIGSLVLSVVTSFNDRAMGFNDSGIVLIGTWF